MNIIQKQPNPSGAYPPIQSWSGETPPDTHYEITVDIADFYNGFIIPTIENDVVIDFSCNTELWSIWNEKNQLEIIFEQKRQQILELKQKLLDTDYICNKIVEGISTKEDYADILAQRNDWRNQINQLESELNAE